MPVLSPISVNTFYLNSLRCWMNHSSGAWEGIGTNVFRFPESNVHSCHVAGANESQLSLGAGFLAPNKDGEVFGRNQYLIIKLNEDVMILEASLGGWGIVYDLVDLNPNSSFDFEMVS
jgi:hypothetical protein